MNLLLNIELLGKKGFLKLFWNKILFDKINNYEVLNENIIFNKDENSYIINVIIFKLDVV